jgi:hypothetical protein
MRGAQFLFGVTAAVLAALALGGCMPQQQASYVIDPATGQAAPMARQQQFTQPQYGHQAYGQPQYAQQPAPQPYAREAYQPPAPKPQSSSSGGRGLFTPQPSAPLAYAQQQPQQQAYAQPQAVMPGTAAYASVPYSAPQQSDDATATRFRWY